MRSRLWMVAMLGPVVASPGCLRFMEPDKFVCESDNDCPDGDVCKEDSLDSYCRDSKWCEESDHCEKSHKCDTAENLCVAREFGDSCSKDSDCDGGPCVMGTCRPPNCDDGRVNGNETDVDCGGDCQPCHCINGALDPSETDEDCGGDCNPCRAGEHCREPEDCQSLNCVEQTCRGASCGDGIQNSDETDVDCGGRCTAGCADGLRCDDDYDCESGDCTNGVCVGCADGVQNQDETDTDCGGLHCSGCADGLRCAYETDCESADCSGGVCVGCADGVQNRDETDVDCGGQHCADCADGLGCAAGTDCESGTCESGVCVGCSDGIQNRDESAVDCGGNACDGCDLGQSCTAHDDCALGCMNPCRNGTCEGCWRSASELRRSDAYNSPQIDTVAASINTGGDIMVAWTEWRTGGSGESVRGVWYRGDFERWDSNQWGDLICDDDTLSSQPVVVQLSDTQAATVLWEDTTKDLQLSRNSSLWGSWGSPVELTGLLGTQCVAFNTLGQFLHARSSADGVTVTLVDEVGAPQPSAVLASSADGASSVQCALADDGAGLVAWKQGDDVQVAALAPAGGSWAATTVQEGAESPCCLSLGAAGDGTAALAWRTSVPDSVWVSRRDASGSWSTAKEVPGLVEPELARVGAMDGGKVFLVWKDGASGRPVKHSTYDGDWSTPEEVSSDLGSPTDLRLWSESSGHALLMVSFAGSKSASVRRSDGTWATPEHLEGYSSDSDCGGGAVRGGRAVAVWCDESNYPTLNAAVFR